jgi:hypothetical protein
MPAYYTSWGRYTELTGLLIFPVVIALILSWHRDVENKNMVWTIILAAIAAGGVFIVHYRVITFLGCFLIAYLIIYPFTEDAKNAKNYRDLFLLIFFTVIVSLVFVLPWFIPTIRNVLVPNLASVPQTSRSLFADFTWPYQTSALGKQALVLAGLGLIWSLIKKWSLAILVILWVALMFFLANLDLLHLPGGGLITSLSVEIILFIPVSIIGGYFLQQFIQSWKQLIPSSFSIPAAGLMVIIFGFVAFQGARQLIPILRPITILSRQADLPAIEWIDQKLPSDTKFAINPFPWGYGLYAGNDGGYWIEPLSGRFTLPPPVLYGLEPGNKIISQQSQQVIALSTDPHSFHDYLMSQDIHYIFVGTRGGVIPPERLVSSGLFEPLYHQDGAWVIRVKP